LFELVGATNKYMSQPPSKIKIPIIQEVSRYIFDMLKCFGIYESGDYPTVTGDDSQG